MNMSLTSGGSRLPRLFNPNQNRIRISSEITRYARRLITNLTNKASISITSPALLKRLACYLPIIFCTIRNLKYTLAPIVPNQSIKSIICSIFRQAGFNDGRLHIRVCFISLGFDCPDSRYTRGNSASSRCCGLFCAFSNFVEREVA